MNVPVQSRPRTRIKICGITRIADAVAAAEAGADAIGVNFWQGTPRRVDVTQARAIVMDEPGTIAWFAIQFGPSSFGVYDAFPDDEARDAHLAGGVGQALGPNTGVLFSEPQIEKIDILADKVPV